MKTKMRNRGNHSRKGVVLDEDDDINGEIGNFKSAPKTLEYYLEQLSEKRGFMREEALSAIIEALTNMPKHNFMEKNFATLLYRFLFCMKKGSAKEIQLASHAIGLLAMTIDSEDHAHELYEDSLPVLSQSLKSGSKTLKILDCLVIVTFFGANNSEDTERAMQIIWKFICPESGSNLVAKNHSAGILAAAISAWSFLLTSMEGWRLNYKYWQGAISYFSNLLEENDESVRVAAGETLALIFETNCLEKFSSEVTISTDGSSLPKRQELKDNIVKQLRNHSMKARDENSAEENAMRVCKTILNVLKYFEDDKCLDTYETIRGQVLTLSTWSRKLQLNFIKRFLGENGFLKHMMENEHLHDVFEFIPRRRHPSGNTLYIPIREEVTVNFFRPGVVRQKDCSLLPFVSREEKKKEKRLTMSPNSFLSKARTQLLNKQRLISKESDGIDD